MHAVDALTRHAPRRVRFIKHLFEWGTWHWTAPVRAVPARAGFAAGFFGWRSVPPRANTRRNVCWRYSSPLLGEAQSDWPPHTHVTGFAHYAQPGAPIDAELDAFLREGSPPLVFTLGSAAVHIGADFLRASIIAAERLNRRAVLFAGTPIVRAQLPAHLPATMRIYRLRAACSGLSTCRRHRASRWHRHQYRGLAFGTSHAGGATWVRSVRQCRQVAAPRRGASTPRAPLHCRTRPCRC